MYNFYIADSVLFFAVLLALLFLLFIIIQAVVGFKFLLSGLNILLKLLDHKHMC